MLLSLCLWNNWPLCTCSDFSLLWMTSHGCKPYDNNNTRQFADHWLHGLRIIPTFVLLSQFLGSLRNGLPRAKKLIMILIFTYANGTKWTLEEIMRLVALSVCPSFVLFMCPSLCLSTRWLGRNGGALVWKLIRFQRYALSRAPSSLMCVFRRSMYRGWDEHVGANRRRCLPRRSHSHCTHCVLHRTLS